MTSSRIKKLSTLAIAAATIFGVSACNDPSNAALELVNPDAVQVVATFSILTDMVEAIGGENVQVHSIVPIGVDPHTHTPLSQDIKKTTDADLVFWNGLNLELGDGWFESLMEVSGKTITDASVIEVSVGVEPMYLTDTATNQHTINPHAFLDPNVGMIYIANIGQALMSADPDNAEAYQANTDSYLAKLDNLDQQYRDVIQSIAPKHRTLVTSENAFQYMAHRYGLKTAYLWEIDTEESGTPQQLNRLIDQLRKNPVPALFVETNVDPRPMQSISEETDIPIYGPIFSDELGKPGHHGDIYLDMLQYNIDQIAGGLAGKK